jgi:uncharacterized repeat protein (TIGR01451 family)
VIYGVGQSPRAVTMGDFNGDGKQDLAVADYDASEVLILLNSCKFVTTTTVGSSANPSGFGQVVTFTANVTSGSGGSGIASGTVIFRDGATVLGAGTLAGGTAILTTSTLTLGSHSITAVYGGDGTFAGSASAALGQLVDPVPADLSIAKTDGQTTAAPGSLVVYTIVAANAGPNPATGAMVMDTVPAMLGVTWTCVGAGGGSCTGGGSGDIHDTVNLPVGGTVTYTLAGTISASATGSLSNTATVMAPAGVTDPNAANNSATDTDTLEPAADLSITKTDGQGNAAPGSQLTYTIVASNAGPSIANGATVTDTVPAAITSASWTCVGSGGGTCTAGGSLSINDTVTLPVGGSVTYTLTGMISASETGSLSNTATVTAPAGVTDPDPANNSATDTDTLGLEYFTLAPCRIVDTRGGAPNGGPVLQGQQTRVFAAAGNCGIPSTAKAVSINMAVTLSTAAGNVRLFPAGQAVPTTSSINYGAGQTRANNAIVSLDHNGQLAAFLGQTAGTTVHLIIDVNGYFE